MKFIICLFAIFVATQAFKIDWENVKHKGGEPKGLAEHFHSHGGRIVGGQEAAEHQFPYQAAIFFDTPYGQYFCGGSLISDRFVLTAAHCAADGYRFYIILGAHNIYEEEPTQVQFTTEWKLVHPEWDPYVFLNDIAILALPQAAPLNENIQIVRLPSRSQEDETFADENSIQSGWGQMSDYPPGIVDKLRYVSNPILTNEKCEEGMLNLGLIKDTNICQSGEGIKSSCSGDSGGPLVIDEGGSPTEVGIVSFGLTLGCEQGIPSAFTRISKYLDWIEQNTNVQIRP